MTKKRKLNELEQVHGKIEEKFEITTLDQLWGDDGLMKYKTMDKNEYEAQLREMNTSDLRAHAIKIGIVPIADRERLTKRLLLEFSKHVNAYRRPIVKPSNPKKVPKEIMDFLAEAKS